MNDPLYLCFVTPKGVNLFFTGHRLVVDAIKSLLSKFLERPSRGLR